MSLFLSEKGKQVVPRFMESNHDDIPFNWGKKRGIGGAKRNIQFYESFSYDNLEYSLYDCVYLWKEGQTEPYIGKLVKIWEQPDHKKKVKILWFFRPNEIQKYFEGNLSSEKEIFLASGEGVGLTNINPLEAIAGKCRVVCTSTDNRNQRPSARELELADYIFYRTFDVGTYTISDVLADKIAGVEVKFLLNQKDDQKPVPCLDADTNGTVKDGKHIANTDFPHSLTQTEFVETLETVVETVRPSAEMSFSPLVDATSAKQPNEANHISDAKSAPKCISSSITDGTAREDASNHYIEKPKSSKISENLSLPDDRPTKKIRQVEVTVKSSGDLQKNKIDSFTGRPKVTDDGDMFPLQKKFTERKPSERKVKSSDESLQKDSPALIKNNREADSQLMDVPRRPDLDRTKWFKGLSWDSKLEKANRHEVLLFLENVDPSYTSRDIEDIFYHAFKQSCTAKVIPRCTFQDENYGEAYVILNSQDEADLVVQKMNYGCLMQQNGRPLVCSKGMLLLEHTKSSTLAGHLAIDKVRLQMQREEMKRAVSTSHCSQPNTIEYEMAMDWMLAQEKSAISLSQLHERHRNEIGLVRRSGQTK